MNNCKIVIESQTQDVEKDSFITHAIRKLAYQKNINANCKTLNDCRECNKIEKCAAIIICISSLFGSEENTQDLKRWFNTI